MERIELGKYVVIDPSISYGKPTFKGTQIPVQDVLETVADTMNSEQIIEQWQGRITQKAVAEAISIGLQVFLRKVGEPKERVELGAHIFADPTLHHGRPMFNGEEALVEDLLADIIYGGADWKKVIDTWYSERTKKGIAEAVFLASQVFAQKDGKPMGFIELGEYVVAHPDICDGKLTFKGTQICIQDVLEMVAEEMDWDQIIHQWCGSLTKAAITDAILVASEIFIRRKRKPTERIEYGKYVVADPGICHGKVTFNGTRIFVQSVLEMVAEEKDWERIIWEYHDSITKEGIAEAIFLASQVLSQHATNRQEEEAA